MLLSNKMICFSALLPNFFFVACAHQQGRINNTEVEGNWRAMPERRYEGVILFSASKAVGHGFREVAVSVPSMSQFESVAHYKHLYYRNQFLADNGNYSISTSGRYAAYHYEETMELFDSQCRSIAPIAHGLTTTTRFEWSPDEESVTLEDSYRGKRVTISTKSGEQAAP